MNTYLRDKMFLILRFSDWRGREGCEGWFEGQFQDLRFEDFLGVFGNVVDRRVGGQGLGEVEEFFLDTWNVSSYLDVQVEIRQLQRSV